MLTKVVWMSAPLLRVIALEEESEGRGEKEGREGREGGEGWRGGRGVERRNEVNVAYHLALLSVTLSVALLSLKLPRSWRWFQTGRERGVERRKKGERKEKELEELLCGTPSYRHEMNSLPQEEWSGAAAQRH